MASTTLALGDLAIERELSQVAESFRFVLDVTPVDVEERRGEFLAGTIPDPVFTYRELEDDPAVIGATLEAIDVDEVEDATLGQLLRAKQREIGLQLEMLKSRGTSRFLTLSETLYGSVDPNLLQQAEAILEQVPASDDDDAECVDAARFAELGEKELAHYRAIEPDLGVHIEIRPDVSGVMVSGDVLLVSSATRVRASRVEALLQHEVGTHLVTHINGSFQPIRMLSTGLAGYEETQEGLAVLAEYLVGGLSTFRLRQLAARVVAVEQMMAGARFREVHQTLVDGGFPPGSAFTTTMRVFRSGGLTKDAIYLRGLLNILGHLKDGGDLDLLWLGKMSLDELPLIDDLLRRGVLERPKLLPRYLGDPVTAVRLEKAASLTDLTQLIGDIS